MSTDPRLPYPGPPTPSGGPPAGEETPGPTAQMPRQDAEPPQKENGAGVAALVLGIVGVVSAVLGWLIITIPVALAAGGLALYFGIRGRRLARRGQADNPGRSLAGVILGSVALGLVVVVGTAAAVAHHHGHDRWGHDDRDDPVTFERCIEEADGRGDLAACLRAFPEDARSLGVTVQP